MFAARIKTLESGKFHDRNNQEEINSWKIDLWTVNGFLLHSLDTKKLQTVANKYSKLGLVPEGYF